MPAGTLVVKVFGLAKGVYIILFVFAFGAYPDAALAVCIAVSMV
jgi:hypothetical protein